MKGKLSTVATMILAFCLCLPINAKAADKPKSTILATSQSCDAEGIVSPLIGVALKSIFSMFFESADSSIERKLKQYQKSEDFRLELNDITSHKCVTISQTKGVETYLELKYSIELVEKRHPNITSFRLRPHSVRGNKKPALPKGDKFSFSNSVKAWSFSDQGRIQVSGQDSEVLLSRTYVYDSENLKLEVPLSSEYNQSSPIFHIPAINGKAPPLTLIFTHSVVGSDPSIKRRKRWRKFLSKSSDGLNETFTDAILKLIETDDGDT